MYYASKWEGKTVNMWGKNGMDLAEILMLLNREITGHALRVEKQDLLGENEGRVVIYYKQNENKGGD